MGWGEDENLRSAGALGALLGLAALALLLLMLVIAWCGALPREQNDPEQKAPERGEEEPNCPGRLRVLKGEERADEAEREDGGQLAGKQEVSHNIHNG